MKSTIIFPEWKNTLRMLPVAVLLTVATVGCGKVQPNYHYVYGNPGGKLTVSAWDFIGQTDSMSLMKLAISTASLQDLYAGTDSFTFIVPRNSAWRTWLKNNHYADIPSVPLDTLQKVLKYHIVKAKVLFSDPALLPSDNPIPYETLNGQTMFLSHNTSYQGLINQGTKKVWTIITSNLQPTNGVIHVTADVVYLSI